MLSITPLPILSDNYAYLLRCTETGVVAIVDSAEEAPCVAAIEAAGGRLDLILLTHHHGDHIAAAEPLRAKYGARIVGAKADAYRLRDVRETRAVAERAAAGLPRMGRAARAGRARMRLSASIFTRNCPRSSSAH